MLILYYQARIFKDITVHSAHCSVLLQTLTVPYLIDNPEVGYVQTRWVFANPDESYLTKVSHYAGYCAFKLVLH